MGTRQALSVKEEAQLWGGTPTTVRRWAHEGVVTVEPIHARRWVVVLEGRDGLQEQVGQGQEEVGER